MSWDPAGDAWLSGFADGEGYFQLRGKLLHGYRIEPRFRIHLRADDGPVLRQLQETFGGNLRLGKNGAWNPQVHWDVCRKEQLLGLVDYFDRFPLRAKKAGDYAIWREAVIVYCETSGVNPRLVELAQSLVQHRAYSEA